MSIPPNFAFLPKVPAISDQEKLWELCCKYQALIYLMTAYALMFVHNLVLYYCIS